GGLALFLAKRAVPALLEPARQILRSRQAPEMAAQMRVLLRPQGQGVVPVPVLAPPRPENHLLPSVVRMKRPDLAAQRIVEPQRTDADRMAEPVFVVRVEEGLVAPDRLALVVEDGPAAGDPSEVDDGPTRLQRPGFGERLRLDGA